MSKVLPVMYSRSAVVADWRCPRQRYWAYEAYGRGISPTSTSLELFLGITVHDGLAAIAAGLDIDEIAKTAVEQVRATLLPEAKANDAEAQHFAAEQAALVEGLLRGFYRQVWPVLMRDYEIVCIEQEMTYEHDGLTFLAKPDLILRHKESKELVYLEFKTTSSIKEQWINSWETAIQVHSSIKAAEATLGEPVTQVIIQGLNKGYFSQWGRQESPLIYGYFKSAQPPFSKEIWTHEYKAGLRKSPAWNREGGIKKWIAEMPPNILAGQFPRTPPITVNEEMVEAFFRQRAQREHLIRTARDMIVVQSDQADELLSGVFPQNFEACAPSWGHGCEYKNLCHGFKADPLKQGYQLRVSHHKMEQDVIDDMETADGVS